MTADEFKKIVETVHERVSLLLCPLGIVVERELTKVKKVESAEFTLKIPDPDKSKPGVYQELVLYFTQAEAVQCQTDPKQLDCLPRAWGRICAEWAPTLFDEAKLPVTDGVDWRPHDTLPEDFYAA
jgi:hypothetical protein